MAIFTTYAELITYFEALGTDVTELKGVTVGHDEDLLNKQNTQIRYPHLWVETPDVQFIGTDANPSKRFRFAVAVVAGEGTRTGSAANTLLSSTLTIMEKIWAQMLADADLGDFDLVLNNTDGAPVRQWSGDNCYGWRLSPVLIDLPRCECDCEPEEEPAP
jgi:hypothetical protein